MTEADNGSQVSLIPGASLVVRLKTDIRNGWWSYVDGSGPGYLYGSLVKIVAHTCPPMDARVRDRRLPPPTRLYEEFRFTVPASTHLPMSSGQWVRLMLLSPAEKDIQKARFWQVYVTIPGGYAK